MNTIYYLYIYLLMLPTFLVLDGVWIGLLAKDFYQSKLGYLFGPVQWWPVMLFYPMYIAALLFFVVAPGINGGWSLGKVAAVGFCFGLVAYATYDLTNQATIKDWPVSVTVVDMLWGASGAMLVTSLGFAIAKQFFV